MTSDRELTRIVQSWLDDPEDVLPERFLDEVMGRVPSTPQHLPVWRALMRGLVGGTFRLALTGVAVLALVILAYGLFRSGNLGPAASPTTVPTPQLSPSASPSTQTPTTEPTPGETPVEPTPNATSVTQPRVLVAYPVCTSGDQRPTRCRIWVANPDGTDEHELLVHESLPDVPAFQNIPDDQNPLAWSADGSRLLYSFSRTEYTGPQDEVGTLHLGLAVTDAAGSETEELEALCPTAPAAEPDLYSCEVRLDHTAIVAISPDGARVAYQIIEHWGSEIGEVEATSLVILDMATGAVTRLDSTQTENPRLDTCSTSSFEGYNSAPTWSPDGTQLAFVRSGIGPGTGSADEILCQNGLFTVDLDSGEVSQVTLSLEQYNGPVWSSDGSQLLFHAWDPTTDRVNVYTIRPDGSGRQALTVDGRSLWPYWSDDERVVFVRLDSNQDSGDTWIADADGDNATRLEETIPALTAAGCVVCPSTTGRLFDRMYWQPIPGGQGGQQ